MAGRRIELDIDNLVERYLAGETPTEIALTLDDVSAETVRRRLRGRNVLLSPADATRRYATRPEAQAQARAAVAHRWAARQLDEQAIAAAYRGGEPARSLRARFHVDYDVLRGIMTRHCVPWRSHRAAGQVRVATEPAETAARRRQFLASLNVGRTQPAAVLRNVALGKQSRPCKVGDGEELLRSWLTERGLQFTPHLAVDRYNIDIAATPVAIEVQKGPHHPLGRTHLRSRGEHLGDLGWLILYVWITPRVPLTERAADEVVAYVQLARRDPSSLRQQWVIRGNGEPAGTPFASCDPN